MYRIRHAASVLLLSLFLPSLALAADPVRVKLSVVSEGLARQNVPVTATIDAKVPAEAFITGVATATLKTDDGFDVPAQLERSADGVVIRWVEPSLASDVIKMYTLTVDPSAKPQAAVFRFEARDGYRDLLLGERPVYRHMNKFDPADFENTYKPFYHVYDFHGDGFITKGAGGKYPHHRGLFLGFKTPHGDFWHCREGVSLQH